MLRPRRLRGDCMWRMLIFGSALVLAGTGVAAPQVALRDAESGAAIAGQLRFQRDPRTEIAVSARGQVLPWPAGDYAVTVSAPGYRDLAIARLHLTPDALPLTVLLDPLAPDVDRVEAERISAALPTAAVVFGYVRRAVDASPIVDAELVLDGTTVTRSDAAGRFRFVLTGDRFRAPQAVRLQIRPPGLPAFARQLVLSSGTTRLLLAWSPAAGALPEDQRQFDRPGADAWVRELTSQLSDQLALPSTPQSVPLATALVGLVPPASIRVGFADAAGSVPCCTGSCSAAVAMSLEHYVARGLNDEWIASWNQASLRAGSIAYRSFGAFHAVHPNNANFDLCSSACCQVNDPDLSGNTSTAVVATAGILLERGAAEPFRSEYSAQNNAWNDPDDGLACSNDDLFCGDGFVGSPATGWPCLADSVALGRGCFGHGRGMSQWGTQVWGQPAESRLWPWIVDHYYNGNGADSGLRSAHMSTPLSLSSLQVTPQSALPGASLSLLALADNAAGGAHDQVLIGASLVRSGSPDLSDPGNDIRVSLAPGSQVIGREFRVPATVTPGEYTLLLALWLDIDGDLAISGNDLAMALEALPGAVQIVNFSLLKDGFETAAP